MTDQITTSTSEDATWRGHIGEMSKEDLEEFLATGVLCHLACLKDDGTPYVVPCWFEWQDGSFYVIPRKRSLWATYLQQRPAVALDISEPAQPYRKVQVEGSAVLVEEPNIGGQWLPIARSMSLRYLGEHGPEYLEPTMNQPRWLFRIEPTRIKTWQGVGWHPRYVEGEATGGTQR